MANEARKKRKRAAKKGARKPALPPDAKRLVDELARRTGLPAAQVVHRALAAYAAAVAPDLAQAPKAEGPRKTIGRAAQKPAAAAAPKRLFVSVDGAPEREVTGEWLVGTDSASQLRVDSALVGARHARIKRGTDGWIFEDLGSPRGSYKGGSPVKVTFIAEGDEIDLAGYLPLRFRLQ